MRILVVENDQASREWLNVYLQSCGHRVDATEDSSKATELLSMEQYDLVVLDEPSMLSENGSFFTTCGQGDGSIPPYILGVSSSISMPRGGDSLPSMVDDLILKPIQEQILDKRLATIQRIITLEQQLLQQKVSLENANTQMKDELDVAARIQRSFLPHAPAVFPDLEFQWGLLPCDELAGDALNVIQLDDDHVGFYLLDVSGHGVSAALMAMTLIHLLSADKGNSVLFESQGDQPGKLQVLAPAKVAERLNHHFPMDDKNGQYFTCIYGILNRKSLQLCYVSAGHPGPVLVSSSGATQSFPSTGMPIGFFPDSTYEQQNIQLGVGDRLYFFSDGIPECSNKYEEQFGIDRMLTLLNHEQITGSSLRTSIDNLAVSVLKWNDLARLNDDVSIIGLEISTPVDTTH